MRAVGRRLVATIALLAGLAPVLGGQSAPVIGTLAMVERYPSFFHGRTVSVVGTPTVVDGTWQDAYYAREYNTPTDRIDAWGVIDLQFRLENDPMGRSARLFVKNRTDDDNITNIIIEDALIGRYRNVRLLEPRTYGVILQKRF